MTSTGILLDTLKLAPVKANPAECYAPNNREITPTSEFPANLKSYRYCSRLSLQCYFCHKHHHVNSPIDSGCTAMPRQNGRMIYDWALLWVINDIRRDELWAERHHIELSADRLVLTDYLWDGLTFSSPTREFEHFDAIAFSSSRCCTQKNRMYD